MAKCETCNGKGYSWSKLSNRDGGTEYEVACKDCGGEGENINLDWGGKYRKGSGSTCFSFDTKISTPTGLQNIVDLKQGDKVVSISLSGQTTNQRVLKKVCHKADYIWKIELVDGKIISTTKSHSFLLETGWKKASEIVAGDNILGKGGNTHSVKKSYQTQELQPVFNLIIDGNYTFIANGVQVHSFTHFRVLRMFFWNLASINSKFIECLHTKNTIKSK